MAVVFNGGAGITASYYRRFAEYLASEGVPTLTYDYRGIGASRVGPLRGYDASFEDWAEHDCTAAIGLVCNRFNVPIFGISHSIGALILGGALNAAQLRGMVMIAPHTGYVGDYRRAYVLPMALLWHGLMPALTALLGYFPGRRLGLGEDIPSGVAMAWARRRNPEPAASQGARTHALMNRLADLRVRALAITLSDDGFATSVGAKRAMALYENALFTHTVITPQQVNRDKLGHWGFFKARELWPAVLSFLRSSVEESERAQGASTPL